jgi:GTPase SAR1 family protein
LKESFVQLRNRLLLLIDDVAVLDAAPGCPCDELHDKIVTNRFNLVVVGQFKRGKTTFINALLGADILPTAVVPLTSIVTVIEYGSEINVRVFFNDGRKEKVPIEHLRDYVTEKGNPRNERDVAEVVIEYPSEYLKDGVRLIDTPGVGSVYQHNTEVAYEYLPRCDATIFLISVDQPLSRAELDFLQDVKVYSDRIFFLQNKSDFLSEVERDESLAFIRKVLQEEVGYTDPEIYPVSARLGLEGKTSGDEEVLSKSMLPDFEQRLHRFLMEEKGMILLRSVANNLQRVISEALLRTELRLHSLKTPLEEIESRLTAFGEKEAEIESEKRDFEILLEGETKRILENILDHDMEEAKQQLAGDLDPAFDEFVRTRSRLSPGKLRKALETFVIDRVRDYYAVFRKNEDTKISMSFEKTADRFIRKINVIIDDLLRFSSELFSVEFSSISAEALWTSESSFYFTFKDEPLMVEMLGEAITSLMPRFISNRIVTRAMRRYLHEMIEQQAGRIRWDFLNRLQKSRLEFRWQMLGKIDETARGIREAVRKGVEDRTRGEETARQREEEVKKDRESLYAIRDEVSAIRTATEKAGS